MMNHSTTDYLQQQQQQYLPPHRARAASASIQRSPSGVGSGVHDLALEMEGLEVSPIGGGRGSEGALGFGSSLLGNGNESSSFGERRSLGLGSGSGRSFGYGSFGGPSTRNQFSHSRLNGGGGRLSEDN